MSVRESAAAESMGAAASADESERESEAVAAVGALPEPSGGKKRNRQSSVQQSNAGMQSAGESEAAAAVGALPESSGGKQKKRRRKRKRGKRPGASVRRRAKAKTAKFGNG